jgi:transposase
MQIASLRRDRKKLERRRLRAGVLFDKGMSQATIAKTCAVTRAAACQWYGEWKKKGQDGLISKGKTGADPKLDTIKRQALKQIILSGPKKAGYVTDFWTLARIKDVTKKKLKIDLGRGSVWRTMITLGFSVQKPIRRAKERNDKAIRDWKLNEFPKLKKMGT